MAYKAETRTTFEPHNVIQPIYTGGSVVIDESGDILVACQGEDAIITSFSTGRLLARIEGVSPPLIISASAKRTLTVFRTAMKSPHLPSHPTQPISPYLLAPHQCEYMPCITIATKIEYSTNSRGPSNHTRGRYSSLQSTRRGPL